MSNMNEIIEKIKSSKHIEIVSSSEKLSLATALYTYIMTQHKKASLVINGKKVDRKFSFLP
ncbi:MAG: phosphoesterase, partial [Epsilonproteobacteria bacterium]|nr:phosphoesterase [Campylobacterota bacterium]